MKKKTAAQKPRNLGAFRDGYGYNLSACRDDDGTYVAWFNVRGDIGTSKKGIGDLRKFAKWFNQAADWLEENR